MAQEWENLQTLQNETRSPGGAATSWQNIYQEYSVLSLIYYDKLIRLKFFVEI